MKTMTTCQDPKIGKLLHAYEVDGLSDEATQQFEIHLLVCAACFETIARSEAVSELLRHDPEAHGIVSEAAESRPAPGRGIKRLLWPDVPLVFRPALLYIIILLAIVFAWPWGTNMEKHAVTKIQSLTLIPNRSAANEAILRIGQDAVITFVYRGALPGKNYRVVVQSDDGRLVYSDGSFDGFDRYETGQILFPAEQMRPGEYQLEISDPGGQSSQDRQIYRFRIES